MSNTTAGALSGRIALLERRLNLMSEQLALLMSRSGAAVTSKADVKIAGEALPTRIDFDADNLSPFTQGFSEREYDEEGTVFRWSGNGPICELRFFLDRSEDRPFRMLVGETQLETLSAITGFVDYAPVPLFIEREANRDVISGVIPKGAYTRLAVVSFLLGHEGLDGYGDSDVGEYNDWTGFRFYAFSAG